jgi:HEAT repeat protein
MILAEAGKDSPELEETFKEHMHHEEPKVRVEAVYGMINLLGPGAEETLMKALTDESPLVRKKAVWALGKIPSTRDKVITYYIDMLTGKHKEDDFVLEQVLTTVQNYPVHLDETRKLEQAILEALGKKQGILGRFSSGFVYSDHLRTRMFETLKYIGSEKSISTLTKIAKKDSHVMRVKALKAVEKIRENKR